MLIRFATCERKKALSFLRGHYPGRKIEDTPESAAGVLNFVEKDFIRIPDPNCHDGTIYPSGNWPSDKHEQNRVIAALKLFHDATLNTTLDTQ